MASSTMKTSLMTLAIVLASISSLTLATPTNSETAANNGDGGNTTTVVFEESFSTRPSFVVYPPTTTATPITAPKPWPKSPSDRPSPSAVIVRENMTIEEWVSTKPDADVVALGIITSLMPLLRSELNPNRSDRYRRLARWYTPELPTDTPSWDLLMRFFVLYPAICDAFTPTSVYVTSVDSCVQRKRNAELLEAVRARPNTPTWLCRAHPFATNCSAEVALAGTGIPTDQVAQWQTRMRQFSTYQANVRPLQKDRMVATEEAMSYQYVACLQANADHRVEGANAALKRCIDGVTSRGGRINGRK